MRTSDVVRHSLDASISLHISSRFEGYNQLELLFHSLSGQNLEQFLKEYFIVSQVFLPDVVASNMHETIPGVFLSVNKAAGEKCVRCWQLVPEVLQDGLCSRCYAILKIKS